MANAVLAKVYCPVEADDVDGPLVIEPEVSRVAAAVVLWIAGGTFTGIAGTICVFSFNPKEWFSILCPGIFLLIGIGLDFLAFFYTLKCFNPLPVIALSERNLYPGTEFEVSWMFRGNARSISKLTLKLIGKEKVSYREGTKNRTEESIFFSKTLVETDSQDTIERGFEEVTLPPNMMHTFKSNNNEIQWLIQVNGVVARWPDIDDAFPVTVLASPYPVD